MDTSVEDIVNRVRGHAPYKDTASIESLLLSKCTDVPMRQPPAVTFHAKQHSHTSQLQHSKPMISHTENESQPLYNLSSTRDPNTDVRPVLGHWALATTTQRTTSSYIQNFIPLSHPSSASHPPDTGGIASSTVGSKQKKPNQWHPISPPPTPSPPPSAPRRLLPHPGPPQASPTPALRKRKRTPPAPPKTYTHLTAEDMLEELDRRHIDTIHLRHRRIGKQDLAKLLYRADLNNNRGLGGLVAEG